MIADMIAVLAVLLELTKWFLDTVQGQLTYRIVSFDNKETPYQVDEGFNFGIWSWYV